MKKLTQLLESKFIKSTQELEAILEADENTGAEKNPVKDAEPEQATDQADEQNGPKNDTFSMAIFASPTNFALPIAWVHSPFIML